MYYLNKIVGWCLSPLGILFAVGLLAWLLGRVRRFGSKAAVAGRVLLRLALIQLWILGCGVTTRWIGVPLEGDEQRLEDIRNRMAETEVDAIVLLGGGMGVHAQCARAEMFGGADRCWTAAKLWTEKKPLTVSGGGAGGERALLKDMGVAEDCIVSIEAARNTEEEARMIRNRLAAAGAAGTGPTVALVTSAWHMPRAKMLFERVGFKVLEAPCDYEMHMAAEEPLKLWDFFPNADALLRNSYALKEWVARFCYWLKGCAA